MWRPPATGERDVQVERDPAFDGMVDELAEHHPGVREAVDNFVLVLQLAGAAIPAQLVGKDSSGSQFVHRVDDPSRGAAGKARFAVSYYLVEDSPQKFKLVDIWVP